MSYLIRDQQGTYYFRRTIPPALRPFMPEPWTGKTAWKVSLATKTGSIVVVDDTPRDWDEFARVDRTRTALFRSPFGDLMPGKGALIHEFADPKRFEVIAHEYQLTLRRNR